MKIRFFLLLSCLFPFLLKAQTHEVTLLFAGDAMQHKSQLDDAKQLDGSYDYSNYFVEVEDQIQGVDIAVVNLESPLAGAPYTGYPMFCAPDEFAQSLKNAGFDIFLTANNHALDKKAKGLERTCEILDELNVLHTGTFKDSLERRIYYPLMLLEDGIRIAILNYTYGTNGMPVTPPNIVNLIDTTLIKQDIANAKKLGAHIIIANMHWGEEYILKQNKEQEKLANFLVAHGVRLVIGNHPHVVQPVDIRRDNKGAIESIIIYSLGNFVSGMRTTNTSGGMMAKIGLSKEPNQPVIIDYFDYSLVWTHKPKVNGVYTNFKLLPVEEYEGEQGKEQLGQNHEELEVFSRNAKEAIESLW